MRRTRAWTAALAGSAVALSLGLTSVTPAGAAPHASKRVTAPAVAGSDMRELTPGARSKSFAGDRSAGRQALKAAKADPSTPPKVGDTRTWMGYDELNPDVVYPKRFVLRGIGDNIQVWVANDRAFPTDDCRNDLGLTDITQKQVNSFIKQFDANMYPKESRVFSTPPDRNGKNAAFATQFLGVPADYFKVGKKQSDDIVALIDNVRDVNYYAPQDEDGKTFIGGFFLDFFNEAFDRNVMTIDAFDWLHRTGANPPDDSADPDYEACAAELGRDGLGSSRPRDYEGTFAHEYQHLLEYYEDTDEVSWVNEGVSDWAQSLTGYVNPRIDPAAEGADGHMACFAGYLGESFGGPENSLTQWNEQGAPETLCDYGAAYTFMEYLHSHWGNAIMRQLHRLDANGLDGLDEALDAVGARPSAMQVLHRWQAMVALDKSLDQNGRDLRGGNPGAYTASSLRYHLRWSTPEAYGDDGAPANGSDYVRLRDGNGSWLKASDITSISFDGQPTALGQPVEWTVDSTPPDATTEDDACFTPPADGSGPAALYSGCGDDLDRSIAREVTVGTGDAATLEFDTLYDIEEGYDFGVVQVSDDGGETWTSLETEDTTSEHASEDNGFDPALEQYLPGLTGDSGEWRHETADLSPYAGENVLIAFRYLSDSGFAESGWWLRDVTVGSTTFPNTLEGWQSQTQIHPDPVDSWTVQLVAYGASGDPVWRHRLTLDDQDAATLDGDALRAAIGDGATTVAAIVSQDDPNEDARFQAGYLLRVNGVTQPGGGINDPCDARARC
jgi:hypothetical protein